MHNKIKRKIKDKFVVILGWLATGFVIIFLGVLIVDIFIDGIGALNWQFLSGFPSRDPKKAGILPALINTLYLTIIMTVPAFFLGVGAAIYLEEYAKKNWINSIIEVIIFNLAAIPSIIYGVIGLGIFVWTLGLGKSLFSGGLTLCLLLLPIITISAREAIRAIPLSFREASYALGATKWQTVYHVILPSAFSGILTGLILAISRGIGEAAPLITVGAVAFLSFLPTSPMEQFTALPIQIFHWISYPQKEFHKLAAAGIIVLLSITVSMNALAFFLRSRLRKKQYW